MNAIDAEWRDLQRGVAEEIEKGRAELKAMTLAAADRVEAMPDSFADKQLLLYVVSAMANILENGAVQDRLSRMRMAKHHLAEADAIARRTHDELWASQSEAAGG